MTCSINTMKDKIHIIPFFVSDAEKTFGKIQHSFMIKTLKKTDKEATYFSIINVIQEKSTVNIIINGENLKAFLGSRTRQGCSFSPLLINVVLEVQARAIRQEKKIKDAQMRKDVNYCYLQMTRSYMQKILKTQQNAVRKNEFGEVVHYRINLQKSVEFLHINNRLIKTHIKTTIPLTLAIKRIKYLHINQRVS